MLVIAQTNLQLYNELCRQQRSTVELAQVRAAYELAMELFSAQYRASGKPFLAHLVGTASLLAWMRQSMTIVTAGLLHAAFEFGDFGDGASGVTPARRRRLTAVVGAETSNLVAAYQVMSRAQAMLATRNGQLSKCSAQERFVLLIHLADTVEEYADCGVGYAPGKEQFYQQACDADVAAETVAAVKRLGLESYANELSEIFETTKRCATPPELSSGRRGSFRILPGSCRERSPVRWRRTWQKLRGNVADTIRRLANTHVVSPPRAAA